MNWSGSDRCMNRTQWPPSSSPFYYADYFLVLICLIGVVGNVLNLIVLTSRAMRSKTNVFLSAMACADLLFLLTILWLTLARFDTFADWDGFMAVFKTSLTTTTMLVNWFSACTAWFAVAVACERLIAVSSPLKARTLLNRWAVAASVVVIATLSLLANLYNLFRFRMVPLPYCFDRTRTDYAMFLDPGLVVYIRAFSGLSSLVCVLVPSVLLIVFNALMLAALYENRNAISAVGQTSRGSQELRVTLTVCVITTAAVVLTAPSAVLAFLEVARVTMQSLRYIVLIYFFNFLVVVDRMLNFLLYCLASKSFRRKLLLVCNCRRKGLRDRKSFMTSTSTTVATAYDVGSRRMGRDSQLKLASQPLVKRRPDTDRSENCV